MKNNKSALRIFNIVFSIILSLGSISYFLYLLISKNDPTNRLLTCLGIGIVALVPYLIELCMRRKFSNFILLFFNIYLLLSGVVGSICNLYHIVNWYDKVVHTAMGYVCAVIGLFLAVKLSDYKNQKLAFLTLFCFAVSVAIGGLWEIYEFSVDNLLAQTAQGVPVETIDGTWVTSVYDTMTDLICDVAGALLFSIHFVISKKTKKLHLISSMENEFSQKLEPLFPKKVESEKNIKE